MNKLGRSVARRLLMLPRMRTLALSMFLIGSSSAALAAPKSPLDQPVSTAAARMEVALILQHAKALHAQGKTPLLVSDLDGTAWTEGPHDMPVTHPKALPGAVKFYREFAKYGTVVYLTGRKASDRKDTLAALTSNGFPVGKNGVLLTNPSDTYGNPIEWKIHAQSQIQRMGQPVAFLENTKKNAIVFRDLFPYRSNPGVSVLYVSDWPNVAQGRIPNGITPINPRYPSATRVRQLVRPAKKP